jgi:hypothetical protein
MVRTGQPGDCGPRNPPRHGLHEVCPLASVGLTELARVSPAPDAPPAPGGCAY